MLSLDDNYEEAVSDCQELTFDTFEAELAKLKIDFNQEDKTALGLINANGKNTNLALLLSDQCPYSIKAAKFEKITKQAKFQYEYGGSVIKQFNEAYSYISRACNGCFWDKSSVLTAPYPGKSLEESILNAVIHRNYNISDSILVKCFLNHIEVISPGGVASGCTTDDVMQGISLLRNPKLAAIFQKLKLAELLGRGLQHIIRPYAVKPQIKVTENVFKVQMFNNVIYGSKELSGREIKVIEYLLDNQFITRSAAAELLNVELQTAGRCLDHLFEADVIKRIDKGRDTKYILYNSEYKVEEEPPRKQYINRIC